MFALMIECLVLVWPLQSVFSPDVMSRTTLTQLIRDLPVQVTELRHAAGTYVESWWQTAALCVEDGINKNDWGRRHRGPSEETGTIREGQVGKRVQEDC